MMGLAVLLVVALGCIILVWVRNARLLRHRHWFVSVAEGLALFAVLYILPTSVYPLFSPYYENVDEVLEISADRGAYCVLQGEHSMLMKKDDELYYYVETHRGWQRAYHPTVIMKVDELTVECSFQIDKIPSTGEHYVRLICNTMQDMPEVYDTEDSTFVYTMQSLRIPGTDDSGIDVYFFYAYIPAWHDDYTLYVDGQVVYP